MLASLLRSTVTVIMLSVVYALLPLDRVFDDAALGWLVLALVGFTAVVVLQVRAVARSEVPRLRAIETLMVTLPMLILIFAAVYVVLEHNRSGSFTQPMDRIDSAYFALTVFATVGFGDIAPVTTVARVIVMLQMVVNLLAIGVIAKIIVGAVQVSVQRRSADPPDGDR